MRISDWSSDVCSSDLTRKCGDGALRIEGPGETAGPAVVFREIIDHRHVFEAARSQQCRSPAGNGRGVVDISTERLVEDVTIAVRRSRPETKRGGIGDGNIDVSVRVDRVEFRDCYPDTALIGVCIGKIRSDNNCAAGRIFTEQRTNGTTNDFAIIDIEHALFETMISRNTDVAEIDANRKIGQTTAFTLR